LPDAGRSPGHHGHFAPDFAAERAVHKEVRVHVPFPVVPQDGGVGFDGGAGDAGCIECLARLADVEPRGEVDELEELAGDAQIFEDGVDKSADGRHGDDAL